ncbi:MAG: M28 family peptidase [Planctomycetes bacterium]|nr:M28 family peptidase [Planctomycetota bacterium]
MRNHLLQFAPEADPAAFAAEPVAVTLRYRGVIRHELEREEDEYARSFARSNGIICERGVVLGGASGWVPRFGDRLVTFTLDVSVPPDWDAVSQGRRTAREDVAANAGGGGGKRRVLWECREPMEEIHLVAAPFVEYTRPAGKITARAFLRTADPQLAERYLEATGQYVEMYSSLLGPYPFEQFALVENFWETGYGMPSFTLLGEKVIRFPFILHSSFPHEILHNWWGNSVYVAAEGGNWCEGLTAYLADHLIKEGAGAGAEYRRDLLASYLNHVHSGRDFPLREFRERHSAATEAVGYGKSLMLWHMLRQRLGDERFVAALRRVYGEYRFRRASFDDLARIFSAAAGEDLVPYFRQWVERLGAPALALGAVDIQSAAGGAAAGGDAACKVRLELLQEADGAPFALAVPVAFTLPEEPFLRMVTVPLAAARAEHEVALPAAPIAIAVDPRFDLFRRIERAEIPATFGQLFGAKRVTIVLPDADVHTPAAGAQAVPRAADWQAIADGWAQSKEAEVTIVREAELPELPKSGSVWILGAENRFGREIEALLEKRGAAAGTGALLRVPGAELPRGGRSFAFALAHPRDPDAAIGWLGSDAAAALPGLARKLPHYGRYSYLVFEGDEPKNVAKGQWQVIDSPLVRVLSGEAGAQPKPPRDAEPLARLLPVFDAKKLFRHVEFLASDECDGRGAGSAGHEIAAQYIAREFERAGLASAGDAGGWFETWEEPDGPGGNPVRLKNVIGVLRGTATSAAHRDAPVVIGAHYDHLGIGTPVDGDSIYNGALDNASGTAGLLTLAEAFAGSRRRVSRSIMFTAFTAEEMGLLGSQAFVTWSPVTQDIVAALNLDGLELFGETADISALGMDQSSLGSIFNRAAAAEKLQIVVFDAEIRSRMFFRSDQASFARAGVPALFLRRGLSFRGRSPGWGAERREEFGATRYHTPDDELLEWYTVDGAVQQLRVIIRTAAMIADGSTRPVWSKHSKFARVRRKE